VGEASSYHDAVWGSDSGGSKEPCIGEWVSDPHGKGHSLDYTPGPPWKRILINADIKETFVGINNRSIMCRSDQLLR